MRYRSSRFLGRLASDRDDHRHLVRVELARTTRSLFIAQHLFDRPTKIARPTEAFRMNQLLESRFPTPTPDANGVTFVTDPLRNRRIPLTLKRQQNHLGPESQPLRTRSRYRHVAKDLLLPLRYDELRLPCHGILPLIWADPWDNTQVRTAPEGRLGRGVLAPRHHTCSSTSRRAPLVRLSPGRFATSFCI